MTRSLENAAKREEKRPKGSRLMDMETLTEGLKECSFCHRGPLSLTNIVSEEHQGLASILNVTCNHCKAVNTVKTSKEHRSGARGPLTYDVNTRAALGCLHVGVGNTHLNNLLSTLNIPTMNSSTFKTREREAGKAVEQVAKFSCQHFLNMEKDKAVENGIEPDENNLVSVSCSYDMGWQKRGRGFNSKTGHAAAMGLSTGKVLDYTTKNKACRTCDEAKKAGKQPKEHDCRKNHSGSSKSMEPLSAVELFNKVTESNVKFSTYTGDDDSTTECHLKQNVPYGVEKWSDTVHTKRSLTTRLYNLSQRGKFPNSSVLSQKVINYLVKCFTYCVAQNKGDVANMKIAIQSIVPHAFGNHTGCRETWCRHKKDPSNYNHRDLPYGKDLQGDSLQSALKSLFDEYSTDIVISKLAPAANSQRNECLNSVVGTKNPKIRYYGGSESSDYRVSCGVAQANVGYKYIPQTLEALNIEPGFFCEVHSLKMEKKSSMDKERKSTLPFKIRRWQLNKQKISETSKKEAKEGSMYESGIGLNLDTSETARQSNTSELSITEFYCTAITKEQQVQYENVVPKYTPRPTINKEKFDDSKCYNFVLFDTETNSTGKSAEICQLAAVDRSGKQFACYILPNKDIDSYASKVNKLTVKTVNGTRRLLKENQPVVTSPLAEVLKQFVMFLKESTNAASSQTTKPVCTVLAGHNAAMFDIPVLLRNGGKDFIAELSSINCIRFADTLTLFKSLIQSKHSSLLDAEGKFPKPNMSSLYEHVFQTTFDAHDAVADVIALRRILFSPRLALSDELLVNRSSVISVKDAAEDMKWLDNRHQRLLTLRGKLYNPGSADSPIKQTIAEKISGSGLGYEDLKNVFQQFGRKGLVCILTRPPLSCHSPSRPRVTNTMRIVSAIVRYFEQNFTHSAT
ncbi:uncharacterized protein LOC144656263 [Oculina patagonica]